jgi:hypothetical protein
MGAEHRSQAYYLPPWKMKAGHFLLGLCSSQARGDDSHRKSSAQFPIPRITPASSYHTFASSLCVMPEAEV